MNGMIELFTDNRQKKRQGEKPLNWGTVQGDWAIKGRA